MSSPSTKILTAKSRCPECGKADLKRVIVSRDYQRGGHTVTVDGLMPDQCPACQAVVWPDSELRRGREMLAIKLHSLSASARILTSDKRTVSLTQTPPTL